MPRAKKEKPVIEKRMYGVDVTPPPVGEKNYWISWMAKVGDDTRPLNWPPDNRIVGIWESGQDHEGNPMMVAWVIAKTEASVKAAMAIDFPETKGIKWRFFELKPKGFRPGDRFPLPHKWMQDRAAKAP